MIASLGRYLPATVETSDHALSRHYVSPEECARLGYQQVAVEQTLYPAEMALRAARECLSASGLLETSIRKLVHTAIGRHGFSQLWSPASWLQQQLQLVNAVPFNLTQGCNAQLIAFCDACECLQQRPAGDAVLVTAADRFNTSRFNRWNSDYGIVYGDGATALALTNSGNGLMRVTWCNTISVPELEDLHRLPDAGILGSFDGEDVRSTKKAFIGRMGPAIVMERTRASVQRLWSQARRDCGLTSDDVRWFVLPNLGRELLIGNYLDAIEAPLGKTLHSWGSCVGHLGCSDAVAGLYEIVRRGLCEEGDQLVLIGAGAGFTWSLVVLEVL